MKNVPNALNKEIAHCTKLLIAARSKKQVAEVWEKFYNDLKMNDYEPRYIRKIVSRVREELEKELDRNKASHDQKYRWCFVNGKQLTNGEYVGIITSDEKMIAKVKEADGEILSSKLNDYDNNYELIGFGDVLNNAIQILKTGWQIGDLSYALGLVTGRRSIEILKLGSFEYVDKQHVIFSGQAKRKTQLPAKVIPVLCDAELIIKAFRRLRDTLPDLTEKSEEQVNKSYAKALNSSAKKHLDGHYSAPKIMHHTRAIYVAAACRIFYDDANQRSKSPYVVENNKRKFISELTGHTYTNTGKGTETGMNYELFFKMKW